MRSRLHETWGAPQDLLEEPGKQITPHILVKWPALPSLVLIEATLAPGPSRCSSFAKVFPPILTPHTARPYGAALPNDLLVEGISKSF